MECLPDSPHICTRSHTYINGPRATPKLYSLGKTKANISFMPHLH